jgi:hypothetical protein
MPAACRDCRNSINNARPGAKLENWEDSMTDLEKLLAIESIKKTKAQYWFGVDRKDWDMLEMTFARNARFDVRGERDLKPGESYDKLVPYEEALAKGDPLVQKGRKNIVNFIRSTIEKWKTVHQGWGFIIDFIDDESAKVIVPQIDYIDDGEHVMRGHGHYFEVFRKEEDGVWRIDDYVLSRTRMDGSHPASFGR